MKQFEVDGDYVWALEVIACHHGVQGTDYEPDMGEVYTAARIIHDMGLEEPMERL